MRLTTKNSRIDSIDQNGGEGEHYEDNRWDINGTPPMDVFNPDHYKKHPSGVECIQITEHMSFCVGNAVKYIWRAGLKENNSSIQDLKKAIWYLQREIDKL